MFLKFSKTSRENTCVGVFSNKVTGLQAWNFIKKETLTQVFSCEVSQIFNNIFLQNTSGGYLWKMVYKTEALG